MRACAWVCTWWCAQHGARRGSARACGQGAVVCSSAPIKHACCLLHRSKTPGRRCLRRMWQRPCASCCGTPTQTCKWVCCCCCCCCVGFVLSTSLSWLQPPYLLLHVANRSAVRLLDVLPHMLPYVPAIRARHDMCAGKRGGSGVQPGPGVQRGEELHPVTGCAGALSRGKECEVTTSLRACVCVCVCVCVFMCVYVCV